ncbi:hypothetical protein AMATHDRAFT_9648 [Amanita thiersii Skay4041]|uniref:Uncharacterized protein n=1 Tax=Amanita thiersii Skay4041 TaxID=703135 RepID=A0A2A9NBZ0_9AGAR|nr:hypothetical protein AMATHDRAFT_9648 [Amanita thiersii Skay4041]
MSNTVLSPTAVMGLCAKCNGGGASAPLDVKCKKLTNTSYTAIQQSSSVTPKRCEEEEEEEEEEDDETTNF